MSSHIDLVKGDTGDTFTLRLTGVSSTFVGATVTTTVWPASGGFTQTLTGSVVNGVDPADGSSCGVLTVNVGSWINTAEGSYKARHQVTFADAKVKTFPTGSPDTIKVSTLGD